MSINQAINLNLSSTVLPPVLNMAQYDANSRIIVATLWDGANPFTVPEGSMVMLRFGKPDGTGGLYDETEVGTAITYTGNVVTAPVATQMLSEAGIVQANIEIYKYDSDNNKVSRLATFRFTVNVESAACQDEAILSSDYYHIISADIATYLSALDQIAEAQKKLDAVAIHPPQFSEDGLHWALWDVVRDAYVETTYLAKGDKGDKGDGLKIDGVAETYSDLPALSADDVGLVYLVEADGRLYFWDGASWPEDGTGIPVKGIDAISPTVTLESTLATGMIPATRVTITDKNGDHEFVVKDGKQGEKGGTGIHGNSVNLTVSELEPETAHPNGGHQLTFLKTTYPNGAQATMSTEQVQVWNGNDGVASQLVITLLESEWENGSQTVEVSGMTATKLFIAVAAPNSFQNYSEAGVYCSDQSENGLTFTYIKEPTGDLTVNLIIFS